MTPEQRVQKARRINAKRDRVDHGWGFGAPGDGGDDDLLRTAMSAIDCGMRMEDWDCVAEGYVMMADLHLRMTGKPYDPIGARS